MEGQTFNWSIYDSWWQHQMLVHAISHARSRGWFLKFQGLFPALLLASFFMRSLTLVPCSLLQNHKEMLATQAKRRPMPSTTDSRSTTLLIKQETGNVSFCEGRMTREREGWKTISARKRMESKRNFWISEISEKQQAYSAQDSQQGDRQVPKHIDSTTNYSVKVSLQLPLWWI